MRELKCQNPDCMCTLNKNNFEILADDDGDVYIFCAACANLPWPMSKVISSEKQLQAVLKV